MEFTNQVILFIGLLFLVSILASVISARLGAPLLLVFLVLGMLLGEEGLGIEFHDVQLAHLIASAALAIILFDGGLRTNASSFRVGLRPAVSLATVGVLATAILVGFFATWILDLHWMQGLLIGAIIGSTDAAAVFSLLHTARLELQQRVASTLEIESGSNDPMAIFLTLVLVEALMAGQTSLGWFVTWEFAHQMGLGALLGLTGALAARRLINALSLSLGLYPLLALASGLLIFGGTSMLGGSGFLAVYLAGLVLGNRRVQSLHNIRRFHDGMAWISQIVMFLMLGLLVTPSELLPIGLHALLIAVVLMFLARPLAVVLSLLPFRFSLREQLFVGWVGLRGAVPIILAIFPLLAGLDNADLYFNVAFFVVLVSLVVQGWSLAPVARLLRLEIPPNTNLVQRLELDLPGQPDYELVGYHISDDSPAANRAPTRLALPEGVKPMLLVREGRLLGPGEVDRLQVGDDIYLVTPLPQIEVLDGIFVSVPLPERFAGKKFFGEFVINGAANMADLAAMYGFTPPVDAEDRSLADFIESRFDKPVVGDRIRLGPVEFVVLKLDGGECSRVGMKIVGEG
jgi:cell volume regulation protein A